MGLQEKGDDVVACLAAVRQRKTPVKSDHRIINLAIQILAQLPDDRCDKVEVLSCALNLVDRLY